MARPVTTSAATAVHEAGHVIAALEMGVRIRYVTMRPADRAREARMVAAGRRERTARDWEQAMVVSAAGMVAEDLWCGRGPDTRPGVADAGRDDLRWMRDTARYIAACTDDHDLMGAYYLPRPRPGYTVDMLAAEAWQQAVRLIYRQWRQVAAVADVLYCAPRAVPGDQLEWAARHGHPAPFVARGGWWGWTARPRIDDLLFWPAAHSRLAWRPVQRRTREGAQ